MTLYDFACILLAFLLPPLAVFMKRGVHSEFWVSLVLTICGWIPGTIYALYVIYHYRGSRHWPAVTRGEERHRLLD